MREPVHAVDKDSPVWAVMGHAYGTAGREDKHQGGWLEVTDAQARFVELIAKGMKPMVALVQSGISDSPRSELLKLTMKSPAVCAYAQARVDKQLKNVTVPLAIEKIERLLRDDATSGTVIVAAARVALAAAQSLESRLVDVYEPETPGKQLTTDRKAYISKLYSAVEHLEAQLTRESPVSIDGQVVGSTDAIDI